MSCVYALAAWACCTLGLSLMVCSTALVPDSFALADDGLPTSCGECTWKYTAGMWMRDTLQPTCQDPCTCPGPPGFPR